VDVLRLTTDAPELAACWDRSRALGASPDGIPPDDGMVRGAALRDRVEALAPLEAMAVAVLGRAIGSVAQRDFLLLLADPEGVVVSTAGGGAFATTARDVRLIAGANWSERTRGTNAIGTAAVVNRELEVHGGAHFGRAYHDLVCYAAPIRGVDGTPLAVLDATSLLLAADPTVGRVIVETARAIEELIRLSAYASAGASVMRLVARTLDRIAGPALLVEARGAAIRGNADAKARFGELRKLRLDWTVLANEAANPSPHGLPLVGHGAWRMRVEPVVATDGTILAMLVVCELGHTIAPARRPVIAQDPFAAIFSEDARVTSAIAWARQLAASELPVMLLAETGAGKELFASALHTASPRARGPWHAINCGALSESLLESELFGYAPGAFTGAAREGRVGLFEAAHGGTLFLDEVAEMSPAMQAAVLRVVETGTFRRVGETRLVRTDVRLVCATCRDLEALVARGAFRQDLYYRLKGASVRIPPLRERTDIVALATHLLDGAATLDDDAAAALARYAWPGNVRELKNALAVARVASGGRPWLERGDLSPEITAAAAVVPLEELERDALRKTLAAVGGNVSEAARQLGVARSTVTRKLKKLRDRAR